MQQLYNSFKAHVSVTQDKEVAGIIENVYSKFKQMLVNKVPCYTNVKFVGYIVEYYQRMTKYRLSVKEL